MSLEAFSAARKQKLSLLRQHRLAEQSGSTLASDDASLIVKRHFRNYDPLTGQLKRFTSARDLPDTVEKDVDGLQEQTIAQDQQRRQEELDLQNIAPKRPNWDLKRDLQKRLKKLEARDREAVILLIRQRIQAQQKAAGLDANNADRNESSVAGLTAEIAASATADFEQASSDLSDDDSEDGQR